MTDQIMAEGKAQKPGLLRRILWWLWMALLSVLLVLSFVFAAPWKVITLFAIFLAAATILPKVYRKWFWLGVGIVIIALVVWVFLPDDNKDWRPYQFDKELAQLQAKYAVPDSENAAIIYKQILADWNQKDTNEPNLPDSCGWFSIVRYGPWAKIDQPEIAAYIRYHQDTIEQLIQASNFEQCSFLISANIIIPDEQFGRYSSMRKWTYLLIAAGNNDIAEGNTNEAVEKYIAVLRMGHHLCQQPSFIGMLVGIAIESLGLSGINNLVVLGDTNEPYLSKVEQAVSEIHHDWSSNLLGSIESKKLMHKNMLGGLFYEVNSKGKTRLDHDPSAMIRKQTKENLAGATDNNADVFSGYWFKKLFKAYTILYWFYAPATPEELGRIVDASFEKNCAMAKPDFDWSKKPQEVSTESLFQFKLNFRQFAELTAKMNETLYFRFHDNYLRSSARQRGTLLIIALRQYKNANGHWPEKLEEIKSFAPAEVFIDPINGDSFVYKRTEENFTLYSKGKNNIDDNGQYDNNWPEKKGQADDQVIWPPRSPKTKKESTDDEQQ